MDESSSSLREIGGYELIEVIGVGGMGRVYRAQDRDGNIVAIKVASEDLPASAHARFMNETLLKLDHPNVMKVLGSGTENNRSYLIYGFLEGESLEKILRRGPMPCDEVVAMGTQLCNALTAAHSAGVIHRDVKPANIIYSPDGRYTLIDFGIALWNTGNEQRITSHGQVVGTASYLAPEQARGDVNIDLRSDLWSLGVLLYEAVSGIAPFEREALLATVLAIVMDEPVPLGDVAPTASAALQGAVSQALRKKREERFSSANAFADALRASPRRATISELSPLSEDERRLVVVLLAEELLDSRALSRAIGNRGGVYIPLGDDRAVGVFGGTSSQGDELVRATLVGLDCIGGARRLAVASGHSTGKHSVVSGATLASAEAICRLGLEGLAVDLASARALAGLFDVQARGGGHVILCARPATGAKTLLIGRDLEFAQVLREIEHSAEESVHSLVLITGQRGIGKSSLLQNVRAEIPECVNDALILRGQAEASEEKTAFSLLVGIMVEHLVEELSKLDGSPPPDAVHIESLIEGMDADSRAVCADFLAELIGRPTRESVQIVAARSDPQLRMDQMQFAIRSYLLSRASRQPLVMLIEDLQWSDHVSMRLLCDLFAASTVLPLCLIATALPENEERYGLLLQEHQHVRLELRPLSRKQVAKLAEAIACQPLPESATAALATRTHGNPLFIEHLVRHMYQDVGDITEVAQLPLPPTIESAIQSHLDNLGPGIKEVCKRAAVFTHDFSASDLAALGVPPPEGVLDSLVRRGVLNYSKLTAAQEQRYIFRNNLVADVAYGMLLAPQRVAAHASAARLLARDRPQDPEDVARHFERGGSDRDAAHWYHLAAQFAGQRGDADMVLRCSEGALRLAPGDNDFKLHMLRSDAMRFLGHREEQGQELESALAAAQSVNQKARAMTEYAWNLSRTGKVQRALEMAEAAVDAGRDAGDRECLALALGWRSVALAQLGRLEDAVDALGEATRTAKGASAKVEALAAEWRAQVHAARGDLAQRLLAFREAEDQYNALGDVRRAAGAACNVADLYNRLGKFKLAEQELRRAREGCRRVNYRLVEGYATANLGYALIRQNRIDEALSELDLAMILANETNESVLGVVVGIYRCRAELGTVSALEIRQAGQAIAVDAKQIGLEPLAAMAIAIASAAALLAGETQLSLNLALEAMSIRDRLGGLEEDEAELFVTLAHAYEACDQARAAADIRHRGRERVLAIAQGITDHGLRASFLAMPAHAELVGSKPSRSS